VAGSNEIASATRRFFRLRLRVQVPMTIRMMRPMKPRIPKTAPDAALFCRKPVLAAVEGIFGDAVGEESRKVVTV